MARVVVTGGTGFVGAHCLIQLLAAGHETRTTVRDLKRESEVRAMLRQGGAGEVGDRLTFVRADLSADAGWAEAVAGCDYVLHVASPFPSTVPKDENELIAPARDGALRVLKAARDAGVKRVVLTSSFAAIGYGAPKDRTAVFTEDDWTNLDDPSVQPYRKSKTIAERAAWDFIAREGGSSNSPWSIRSEFSGRSSDPDTSSLDRAREAPARRLLARLPGSLVRRGRCARRRRSAHQGDDRSGGSWRAISRDLRRFRERSRDR